MPSYNRTTAVDPNPGGDSVKQACIDLDADLTGAFTAANDLDGKVAIVDGKVAAHEGLTAAHGATGAVVGTTDAQVLTNKTLTAPKINEDVAITATATELNYCDGVTSSIQGQLDGKEPLITAGSATQYFKGDKSLGTFAMDVLTAAAGKQDALVSASNIKTVNGVSILGTGDLPVTATIPYASSAENAAGTTENKAVDPLGLREAFNATGTAPVFACRAWVNFNGTGTVAIRASGNVSSITDNGTGDYTVNFSTAIIDENYIYLGRARKQDDSTTAAFLDVSSFLSSLKTTTAVQIYTRFTSVADSPEVNLAIFR